MFYPIITAMVVNDSIYLLNLYQYPDVTFIWNNLTAGKT